MAFIPVGDGMRVKMHFTDAGGNEALNVIYVRDDLADPSVGRIAALLGIVSAWGSAEWSGISASTWSMTRLEGQDMNTEFGAYVDQTVSIAGTALAAAAPSEVTVAVSLRTGRAGRSYRGRLYHVGLDDNAYTGDYMSPTNMASIIGVYTQLLTDLSAGDFTWCVCSFVENGVARAAGWLQPITTIVLTDNIVDSMRSRRPRN